MEKDGEFTNSASHYNFGARILDTRLGRWMSVDNIRKAHLSPYHFAANNPIIYVDPDGNAEYLFLTIIKNGKETKLKILTDKDNDAIKWNSENYESEQIAAHDIHHHVTVNMDGKGYGPHAVKYGKPTYELNGKSLYDATAGDLKISIEDWANNNKTQFSGIYLMDENGKWVAAESAEAHTDFVELGKTLSFLTALKGPEMNKVLSKGFKAIRDFMIKTTKLSKENSEANTPEYTPPMPESENPAANDAQKEKKVRVTTEYNEFTGSTGERKSYGKEYTIEDDKDTIKTVEVSKDGYEGPSANASNKEEKP